MPSSCYNITEPECHKRRLAVATPGAPNVPEHPSMGKPNETG